VVQAGSHPTLGWTIKAGESLCHGHRRRGERTRETTDSYGT
jgi:hypothetical protein